MAETDDLGDVEAVVRPLIGVSRCLLGDPVRYDGNSNQVSWIAEVLSCHCELLPVCPELEAGLGVPRPRIRLTGEVDRPRAILQSHPERDITAPLAGACRALLRGVYRVDGMILKARSPSCGPSGVPVLAASGMHEPGMGFFARACMAALPGLPLIDEQGLGTEAGRVAFLIQVFRYHCRRLQQGRLQSPDNG